jgi:hypothetical protein
MEEKPKKKKRTPRKKKSKFIGIVISDKFRKKGQLIPKGTKYDAIEEDSYNVLINNGYIKSQK